MMSFYTCWLDALNLMMRVNADLFFALTEFSSNVMKAFRSPETLLVKEEIRRKVTYIHTSVGVSLHTLVKHIIYKYIILCTNKPPNFWLLHGAILIKVLDESCL